MSIKKNISSLLVYQIGITILNFLIAIIITRLLGASGRGQVAIYNNAVTIATTVFGISLSSALVYYIASKKINANQGFTIIAVACIGALGLLSISGYVLYSLDLQSYITPFGASRHLLVLFIVHVLFTIFTINISALLNAKEQFIVPMQLQFAQLIIVLIGLIILQQSVYITTQINTAIVIKLIIIVYLIHAIILLIFAIAKYGLSLIKIDTNIIKQVFAFSAFAFTCNVVQMLSYRIDLLFLHYYHTAKIVGIYSIAVLCVQMLWIIPAQFANVFYTKFNQHQHSNGIIKFVSNITASAFWACLLVFAVAWLASIFFIPLFFGDAFGDSFKLLGILLIGAIPIGSALMISTYNGSANLLRKNLSGSIIGFVFCIIFNFLLIPKYSYYGAAIASALAYIANCIYLYLQFCKANKISITTLFIIDFRYLKNIKTHWYEL